MFYTENRFSHSSARRAFSLSEFRNSLESTCKWLSSHVSKFSRKLLISKKIRKNLIFDSFHKYVRKKNIVLYYLHEGFAGHFVWLRSCGQSLVILRSWFGFALVPLLACRYECVCVFHLPLSQKCKEIVFQELEAGVRIG